MATTALTSGAIMFIHVVATFTMFFPTIKQSLGDLLSTEKRDGRVIEELGYYNPFTKMIKFDREKIMQHIKNGAQLTPTVKNFLNK